MRRWLRSARHNCLIHPLLPFLPRRWGDLLHDMFPPPDDGRGREAGEPTRDDLLDAIGELERKSHWDDRVIATLRELHPRVHDDVVGRVRSEIATRLDEVIAAFHELDGPVQGGVTIESTDEPDPPADQREHPADRRLTARDCMPPHFYGSIDED